MIGRVDVIFAVSCTLAIVVDAIRECWPTCVEDVVGSEHLIYRDAAAREQWNQLGADSSNHNTMMHVLVEENALTVVVDEVDEEMHEVLDRIGERIGARWEVTS